MPFKDLNKRKQYLKQYRNNNADKLKQQHQDYYQENKSAVDDINRNYRMGTHPWVRFYTNAKQRCTNPKHPSYKHYGAKGVQFNLSVDEIKQLWMRDKADLLSNPSIDRIDASLDYTYNNCRFVERWLNTTKKVDSF